MLRLRHDRKSSSKLVLPSLGQLVMLSPASPNTLAMIPPSNKALNQMVQPFNRLISNISDYIFELISEFIFAHRKISSSYFWGLLSSQNKSR